MFSEIASAAEGAPTNEENAILTLVLSEPYKDGGYTVVDAQTHGYGKDSKEDKEQREYIVKKMKAAGHDVSGLVNQLFEHNQKSVRLTLKSAPEKGYLIDYDRKYSKYFDQKGKGGGWDQWYKENPKAHGHTTVSLPAYDPKTKLVLIYKGTQSHWLAGAGYIILYRYENGKLVELYKVMLWIS
jgi:hypothetical protein